MLFHTYFYPYCLHNFLLRLQFLIKYVIVAVTSIIVQTSIQKQRKPPIVYVIHDFCLFPTAFYMPVKLSTEPFSFNFSDIATTDVKYSTKEKKTNRFAYQNSTAGSKYKIQFSVKVPNMSIVFMKSRAEMMNVTKSGKNSRQITLLRNISRHFRF